jgi:hypothetical protein
MSHHIIAPTRLASFIAEESRKVLRNPQVELLRVIAARDCFLIEERTRATPPERRPYDNGYCGMF